MRLPIMGMACLLFAIATAEAQLVAAVLPPVRNVVVGQPASAFATIINAGTTTAHGCSIAPATTLPATFLYQTTDPTTNTPTGASNTPVDIPAGGAQTFVIALTLTSPVGFEARFIFSCVDSGPAPITSGVNTLFVDAPSQPPADIIAIAVTATNDGIVNIPIGGTGVIAMAAVNIGIDERIAERFVPCPRTSIQVNHVPSSLMVNICETNPHTGVCLAPPVSELPRALAAGESTTFSLFVQSPTSVSFFDPAVNRLFILFGTASCFGFDGYVWGATSVAVRTQ